MASFALTMPWSLFLFIRGSALGSDKFLAELMLLAAFLNAAVIYVIALIAVGRTDRNNNKTAG